MRRSATAQLIAERVGGALKIEDPGDGWPATGTVSADGGDIAVALFAAPVGPSGRGRDDVERRFQNPAASGEEHETLGWRGRPLVVPPDRVPLLVGIWEEDPHVVVQHPVLVAADAYKREGLTSRHSVFVRPDALLAAAASGWAESVNSDGERMTCFDPGLFPVVALAAANRIDLPAREINIAVDAAGLVDARGDGVDVAAASERARRSAFAIVRDARFSRDVIAAYGGLCAMCGLDLGLVQGAHIYPASAPSSPDTTWNGLCLCSNHHVAFDRYLVWVHPEKRTVKLSPTILAQSKTNVAAAAFVQSTALSLAEPSSAASRPRTAMFANRYDFYTKQYEWA